MLMQTHHWSVIYAIIPESWDIKTTCEFLCVALPKGLRWVQWRRKQQPLSWQALVPVRQLCREHQAHLIINDDWRLAEQLQADGVHLGQQDASIAWVRQQLGSEIIIGASCHQDIEYAKQAEQFGASYLAFGAMYPSATKPKAKHCSFSVLTLAKQQLKKPIVAIGGILPAHIDNLLAHGVDLIAMSQGLNSLLKTLPYQF